jgi:hypothetical protein
MMYYYESGDVAVYESNRSGAGYRGVALIRSWGWDRNDVDARPFQAFIGKTNVADDVWETKVSAQKSWCVQLGYYADVREAAQVAAWAEADPETWISKCQGNHAYTGKFPAETYTLPMTLSAAKAITMIRKKMERKVVKTEEQEAAEEVAVAAAEAKPLNSDSASDIRKNIMEMYGMNFFFGLDVIAKSAIRTLTWEDWKSEFAPTT